MSHLDTNRILNVNQFAYRKGRSTEMAAMKLVADILRGFDDNSISIAVFLDLSRAFDCVNHEILLKKLNHYGVTDVALRWFANYLNNRVQKVVINGVASEWLPIRARVPQGSILGPILFLLYIRLCQVTL